MLMTDGAYATLFEALTKEQCRALRYWEREPTG